MEDPAQREKQGAILCQDWPGFGPTAPEHLFTAADIPADASFDGLIHFFFACYGGGCPKEDNFGLGSGQPPQAARACAAGGAAAAAVADERSARFLRARGSRLGLLVSKQPQRPAGSGDARRDGSHPSGPAFGTGDRQLQYAMGSALRRAPGIQNQRSRILHCAGERTRPWPTATSRAMTPATTS